jgi:hypothetical protein
VLVPRTVPVDLFAHSSDEHPLMPSRPPRSRIQRFQDLSYRMRDTVQARMRPDV